MLCKDTVRDCVQRREKGAKESGGVSKNPDRKKDF